MQQDKLRAAATGLTAKAAKPLDDYEAGYRWEFHFRSWYMHGTALVERADGVIKKTTATYLGSKSEASGIAKSYTNRTYTEVRERIERQRNDFSHARRSWAKGITEDNLWEAIVTFEMTPRRFLEQFHYPGFGRQAKTGAYDFFVVETPVFIETLGKILTDFEEDLATNYELKYDMTRQSE